MLLALAVGTRADEVGFGCGFHVYVQSQKNEDKTRTRPPLLYVNSSGAEYNPFFLKEAMPHRHRRRRQPAALKALLLLCCWKTRKHIGTGWGWAEVAHGIRMRKKRYQRVSFIIFYNGFFIISNSCVVFYIIPILYIAHASAVVASVYIVRSRWLPRVKGGRVAKFYF